MVSIADVDRFRQRLDELASNLIARSAVSNWSELIEKVVLALGLLEVTLNEQAIANYLKLDTDRLASDALQTIAPFQLRRRGVETRIILGGAAPETDETLCRNIANGVKWFSAIRNGATFEEIALREKSSVRRIYAVTNLAFLSRGTIERAVNGSLPLHITTDYLLKKGFPANWDEQHDLFAGSNE
jgi:site-specific DNA recombinase